MTNADVISAFLSGKPAKAGNLTCNYTALHTYNVTLAFHDGDVIQVNPERYSQTSSAHRNALIRRLGERLPERDTTLSMRRPYSFYEDHSFHAYRKPGQ